jgi:hypothetical protein
VVNTPNVNVVKSYPADTTESSIRPPTAIRPSYSGYSIDRLKYRTQIGKIKCLTALRPKSPRFNKFHGFQAGPVADRERRIIKK